VIHLIVTTEGESAADLLTGYGAGALIRIERGTDVAGPFSEVTTVPLVAGVETYDRWDDAGTTSSWYRLRYSNAGGSIVSDYGEPFQPGASLLCTLEDVKLRLTGSGTLTDEHERLILRFIRAVTVWIHGYTGRLFVPTTRTIRVHTGPGRIILIPQGIRSVGSLGVATTGQPETGGTYVTASASDYYLAPLDTDREWGWPATMLHIRPDATGPVTEFAGATFGAQLTDAALGWAHTPEDIGVIAEAAVIRMWQARGSGVVASWGTPEQGGRLLRWISPEEREILEWYQAGDRKIGIA
jgi:hypothetical protein